MSSFREIVIRPIQITRYHRTIVFASKNISADYINIGSGEDISIHELTIKILELANARNISIDFDSSKPNGMMKKCLDISKIAEFGWKPKISLDHGISLILKCLDN